MKMLSIVALLELSETVVDPFEREHEEKSIYSWLYRLNSRPELLGVIDGRGQVIKELLFCNPDLTDYHVS